MSSPEDGSRPITRREFLGRTATAGARTAALPLALKVLLDIEHVRAASPGGLPFPRDTRYERDDATHDAHANLPAICHKTPRPFQEYYADSTSHIIPADANSMQVRLDSSVTC